MNEMTFLGTGTSVGVPMIGCECEVCLSPDTKDKRMRTSAYIQTPEHHILIDIGPDIRTQALTYNITKLDTILVTHSHRDHVGGFDDVRAFNFIQDKSIQLYATPETYESIRKQFYYAFQESSYKSLPMVDYHEVTEEPFDIGNQIIEPIEVMHGQEPCTAYRIGNMAYVTDANYISPASMEKLNGLDILVINSLRTTHHPSHFTLDEVLRIVDLLKPNRTYLTHISHHLGKYEDVCKILPENVQLAYDGLKVQWD